MKRPFPVRLVAGSIEKLTGISVLEDHDWYPKILRRVHNAAVHLEGDVPLRLAVWMQLAVDQLIVHLGLHEATLAGKKFIYPFIVVSENPGIAFEPVFDGGIVEHVPTISVDLSALKNSPEDIARDLKRAIKQSAVWWADSVNCEEEENLRFRKEYKLGNRSFPASGEDLPEAVE